MNGNHKSADGPRLHFLKDAAEDSMLVFLDGDVPGDGVCIGIGDSPVAACDDAISCLQGALQDVYRAQQAFKGDA